MTRVDEFDHFYSSTADITLRATYAVCGDRNVAFEATVDAYRHAWRDWNKIRNHQPDGWVRTEAWRLTALSRSTHPLRQKHEEDSDGELLSALSKLRVDDRRLIALLTLGSVDLEEACREVGVPAQQGAESVTTALGGLESSLVASLDQIEERMHGLSRVTRRLMLPAGGVVRHRAQIGRRRNTVALIGASVVLAIGGGVLSAVSPSSAERQRMGEEGQDLVLQAQKLAPDNMLRATQVARIDADKRWKVLLTNDDSREKTPYATCPPRRFADPDPVRVMVRTFQAGRSEERVAQAVEMSRNSTVAAQGFNRLEQWFGDCRLPGVQLRSAWTVRRPYHDFRILQLVSYQQPAQTFTVGIGISGTAVSTLVHRGSGVKGPDLWAFARVLNESVAHVCQLGGGRCANGLVIRSTLPPATLRSPEFLAIIDLPPVSYGTAVWTGLPSDPKKHDDAAVCDKADFTRGRARSRSYVQSADLPKAFGVTETIGRFKSESQAKDFVDKVEENLRRCPDKNLAAQVDEKDSVDQGGFATTSWRVRLELPNGDHAQYRTSVVRRGTTVAHVTFTSAGKYNISRKTFEAMVQRAGQRLAYAK